jgi:hypothetical protein
VEGTAPTIHHMELKVPIQFPEIGPLRGPRSGCLKLQRDGLVDTHGKQIHILDLDGLSRV